MDYNIAQLLKTLVEQNGSDLHIGINSPPRLRVHGSLIPLELAPLTAEQTQELCYRVMNETQKKQLEQRKELDFSFLVRGLARFRANIYYDQGAVAGAFRVIPTKIKSLDELGMPMILKTIAKTPRGLVLVTGPTGSGKSTTLASIIDFINSSTYGHILTIEDPIEFVHSHKKCLINQREVGQDTLSFANALKSALRQDPDVVLLGEMRDLETISIALTTAETGHLVFGTLHTNSSISTINRVVDVFSPEQQTQVRAQLAMTLQAVISQVLVPTIDKSRACAMEILIVTNPIRALIMDGKINQIYSAMQTGQADTHMQTMNQALCNLVLKRSVSKSEALAKSSNTAELLEMLQKRGYTGN